MPNLYEDAVMRQLESIGQPITRKSTTVADLGGEGLDISTLLMLLWMSGIFGKGEGGNMPSETALPFPRDMGGIGGVPSFTGGGGFPQSTPTPLPPSRDMGGVGGVPSLENIDIMSLINMFSRMR